MRCFRCRTFFIGDQTSNATTAAVPSGLVWFLVLNPTLKTLGYFKNPSGMLKEREKYANTEIL